MASVTSSSVARRASVRRRASNEAHRVGEQGRAVACFRQGAKTQSPPVAKRDLPFSNPSARRALDGRSRTHPAEFASAAHSPAVDFELSLAVPRADSAPGRRGAPMRSGGAGTILELRKLDSNRFSASTPAAGNVEDSRCPHAQIDPLVALCAGRSSSMRRRGSFCSSESERPPDLPCLERRRADQAAPLEDLAQHVGPGSARRRSSVKGSAPLAKRTGARPARIARSRR
jgi:hypothetical protein